MARKSIKTVEDKQTAQNAKHSDSNQNMNNENQAPVDAVADEYMTYTRSRCGGALKTGREKLGLSVHEVSSKLKISNKQIEAIEADDFAALPESTIVRGFIRNYAKLLKIEVEPLLDAYNVLVPSKQPLAFTVKPSSTMKVSSYNKPKTSHHFGVALLLLLALGIWYFYQNYIDKPSTIALSTGVENIEALPEIALPAAQRAEQSVNINLPAATTGNVMQDDPVTNTTTEPSDAQTTVNTLASPVSPVINSAELNAKTAKLAINANQETWFSVVDAAGKEIYNKIIFAGNRESLAVKLPVSVIVGNAGGATMTIDNQSVNLAPHTRSNVARIQLDQSDLSQFE